METKKNDEKDNTNAQSGKNGKPVETPNNDKKSSAVQKEVKLLGTSEYHKTAIVEPTGFEIGETATFTLEGLTVKFEVNGEQQQIIKY